MATPQHPVDKLVARIVTEAEKTLAQLTEHHDRQRVLHVVQVAAMWAHDPKLRSSLLERLQEHRRIIPKQAPGATTGDGADEEPS